MDFASEVAGAEILGAAARTANATSGGVDTRAHGRAQGALILLSIGAASGTTPTLDVRVQHSDNDVAGEYADIPSGAFSQKSAAGFAELNIKNFKRFIRVIGSVGGTTPSFTYAVLAVFGDPLDAPL